MTKIEALGKYFKGGQSESEKSIMKEIFVRPNYIKEITDFTLSNYKVALGAKGSGKSLIVDYLNEYYLSKGRISVVIRPKELDMDAINTKTILSEKTKEAKRQIYKLISQRVGEGISSAATENQELFQSIAAKMKPDSEIKKIGSFITALLPEQYARIVKAFATLQEIDTEKFRIDDEVTQYLTDTQNRLILLVDDLDKAVEETEVKFQYNSSWAIVEAAVEIANEIEMSSVLITVRTDIWHLMTKVKKLGSTIFDKVGKPYNLFVDEEWISSVFRRRVVLCYREANPTGRPTYEYDYFFSPSKIGFYGKQEISRSWEQWIGKNTRNRPRDMVRLVQMLIAQTKKDQRAGEDPHITAKALHKILKPYAVERVEFIKQEYIQIFPKIDEVIYKIKQTRYDFTEIRKFLLSVCGIGIEIDGLPLDSGNEKERFRILKILHMASVINPREDFEDGTYRHFLFEEDNDFIDPNSIGRLQKYSFQVHPTFHSLFVRTELVGV